jgi:hypothetical protein
MTRRRERAYHPRPALRWRPLWVRWHSGLGLWTAEVRHLGATTFLGHYASVVDATVAVNVWLASAHGGLWAAWRSRRVRLDGKRRSEGVGVGRTELKTPSLDEALLGLYDGGSSSGGTSVPVSPTDNPWDLMGDER